jgi:hypothetical protein
MALTLDATLAAAQDSASRRPLVEIMSLQNGADIPFDGTLLTTETFLEYAPAIMAHSTGRLIIAYVWQNGATYGIKYVWTDVARQTFSFYTFTESDTFSITGMRGLSLVELADGSVGIVYMLDEGTSKYHLIQRVVPVTGGAGTRAQIAEWDQLNQWTSDPWVVKLGSASYAIYYVRKVAADGHYHFWKRSSTDFLTWGAETETGPASGTTLTQRHANPSLIKVVGNDLFMFFDYLVSTGPNGEELTNCYYAKSADDGASWSAAAAFTNYATYGQTGEHPVALQKTATSLHVLFTLKASALQMDHTTTGWAPEVVRQAAPVDLMFDPAGRKLWVTMACTYLPRALEGVVQIDVDTWTVDKYWNTTTVPAFDAHIDSAMYYGLRSEYPYVVASSYGGTAKMLDVLNVADDTITHYYFESVPAHGIVANVTGAPAATDVPGHAVVVASENRVYMLWSHERALHSYFQVGYIDLTETSDYQWHSVVPEQVDQISALITADPQSMHLAVWPEEDMLCVSGSLTLTGWGGGSLLLYSLSAGAQIKKYNMTTHPGFPYFGAGQCCLYGGRIWTSFPYNANDGQQDIRGLMEVDYTSDVFTFHRPTHVSVDEYYMRNISVGATGKLLVTMEGANGGVAVFDIGADTWDVFNSTTVPGLTPTGENTFTRAIYDETAGQIFAAHGWTVTNTFRGVVAFSEYGAYKQTQYSIGTLSGGSWTFADPDPLVGGYHDHEAVGVPDPGDASSMFVFWRNENVTGVERSIKWDKDSSSLDVSPYIVAGAEIVAHRSIDGRPGSLSFTASHGHLFDPYNKGSLFSIYLRKGRRLTLRWGEEIAGTDYWQNAGTFYVTAARMNFERGKYPTIEVEAEDRRALWVNCHIYATAAYENLPVEILELLMEGYAGFTAAELDFPASLDGQVTIQHQWIDTTLDEIVNQICNRFGYYFRLTVDNKASCRKISDANAVDHAYADLTKIVRFSPDDSYSDFTNRVTVQGQERSFLEVLYAEERVGALSGTVGWWGFKNDFPVYYSADKERTCKNPRLITLEKATSIGFKLSGSITEGITYEDPYDKYCTVTIGAPNLVPLLTLLLIAEFGAMLWDPDPVQVACPGGTGFTIPVAEGIRNTILLLILMILSSTGNYQYEIWAQPVGHIRRSVQSTANDTVHQAEIALVVEKKIEDPLCYSVPDCAVVATFELMVARLQRNRATVEKIAHLQDEEGDTVTFLHPYSGQTVKLFVTDLTRSLVIGEPGSENGAFIDQIEGWVLN